MVRTSLPPEPVPRRQRPSGMRPVPAVVVAGAVLLTGLGACGSQAGPAVPRATVTGIAAACAGPPGAPHRPVTVFAWRGGRIAARQVVHTTVAGGHYRLSLPPGRYLLGARGSGDNARAVVLRPGKTVIVNFTSVCF
jgi:hypothetical protein